MALNLAEAMHDATFAEADRLATAHSKRSPQFDRIDAAIARLHEISDIPLMPRRSLYLARLHFAVERPDEAAAHLAQDMDGDDDDLKAARAAFAVHMAREISQGRRRSANQEVRDPQRVFDALLAAASRQSEIQGMIVAIHRLLAQGKLLDALKAARTLVARDADHFDEAVDIVRRIYRRPYKARVAARIERVLQPLQRTPAGDLVADNIFALKIDAQARMARAQGDAIAAPEPALDDVAGFLDRRGAAGARALVRLKDLFISVFPGDEDIKLAIIDAYARYAEESLSHHVGKKLLECAAQTQRFWNDDAFRQAILETVRLTCTDDTNGEVLFLTGIDDFLSGGDAYIDRFAKAASLVPQIALGGASSLFGDLGEADEAGLDAIETRFDQVERAGCAYVCCADLGYFERYAASYAASARAAGGHSRLHFHIAAPAYADAARAFATHLSGFDNLSFSWERPAFAVPTYYASMRFLRAGDFLAHVAARILLTDIDVTFTKSPDAFIDRLAASDYDAAFRTYDRIRTVRLAKKSQVMIYRYPRLLPWAIVNAACLYLTDRNDGAVARRVARDMRRYLGRALSARESAWWIDQNSLYASLQAMMRTGAIRIANIEDHGLPFGAFDYEGSQAFPGTHPLFSKTQPDARWTARLSSWIGRMHKGQAAD